MTRPVLVAIENDLDDVQLVERELVKRYEEDTRSSACLRQQTPPGSRRRRGLGA
jgi:hypothetical protein